MLKNTIKEKDELNEKVEKHLQEINRRANEKQELKNENTLLTKENQYLQDQLKAKDAMIESHLKEIELLKTELTELKLKNYIIENKLSNKVVDESEAKAESNLGV